ncbi:MAG: alpha/beta hydrolase [Ilumatobacteraceae bacterium]
MSRSGSTRPPARHLQAMEAAWLPAEAAGFAALRPWLRTMRRGDGHPVLVLPGFMTTDQSTAALRMVLHRQGYWAHPWRLGRNIGPTSRVVNGMGHRLEALHDRHQRPVTLIGQSLGGVYARILARQHPDLVRQVISLGSPYRMVEGDRSGVDGIWERFRRFHDGELAFAELAEHERPLLEVPSTSVYSRADGVAPWHTCIDAERDQCENIEVRGSHIGMAVNPAVVVAVLDRLAQPAGAWRPFVPPRAMRSWYPRPRRWHAERPVRVA